MNLTLLVITWLVVSVVANQKTYPIVNGATVGSTDIANNLSIASYQPSTINHQDISRAIIIIHGKRRNAWNYYRALQTAVKMAAVSESSVYIMAPEFLTRLDVGFAQPNSLIWAGNDWMDGQHSINGNVSSLTVLDQLVAYFADKTMFPKLDTVVIAGHSGGGQLVNRYSLVGNNPPNGINLRYVIANPSSFVYLNDYRPRSFNPRLCPGWNTWKFGLIAPPGYVLESPRVQGFANLGSVLQNFAARDIRYLYGQYDNYTHGVLDTSCEAEAQGISHIDRGLAYWSYISSISPPQSDFNQRLDVVPFVGHNETAMFLSKAGLTALFSV